MFEWTLWARGIWPSASLVAMMLSPLQVGAQKIDTLSINVPWTCPPNRSSGAPKMDENGQRLYLHIQDKKGYDVEVWCIRTFWRTFYYRFEYSYPKLGNTSHPGDDLGLIDKCEYDEGLNDQSVEVVGKPDSLKLPDGGYLITVDSLGKYYHHNWDYFHDFHTVFDPRTKKNVRTDTKIVKDSTGRREILKTQLMPTPIGRSASQRSQEFALIAGTRGARTGVRRCTSAAAPAGVAVRNVSVMERGKVVGELVAGSSSGVISAELDPAARSLVLRLDGNGHTSVDFSVPRSLFDHAGRSRFTVAANRKPLPFVERSTDSYRTLVVRAGGASILSLGVAVYPLSNIRTVIRPDTLALNRRLL